MLLKTIPLEVAKKIENGTKVEAEKYCEGQSLRTPSEELIAYGKEVE
jgi:hypothetical protein